MTYRVRTSILGQGILQIDDESSSDEQLERDLEQIRKLDGLYVGQLTISELEALRRLMRARMAHIAYSGAAGLLGLGRVRTEPVT